MLPIAMFPDGIPKLGVRMVVFIQTTIDYLNFRLHSPVRSCPTYPLQLFFKNLKNKNKKKFPLYATIFLLKWERFVYQVPVLKSVLFG